MEATNEKVGSKLKPKKNLGEQPLNPNGDHREKFAIVSDGKGGLKQIKR